VEDKDLQIAAAVDTHPDVAADALGAVMLDSEKPRLQPAGLAVAASMNGYKTPGPLWVEMLKGRGELDSFAIALNARGIDLHLDPPDYDPVELETSNVDIDLLIKFAPRARAFRCRIFRNDKAFAGSGVLIGPTTVLTAYHVIAPDPTVIAGPWPGITVQLSDGRVIEGIMPPLAASPTTVDEAKEILPATDALIGDCRDFAVFRLARPVGALLGTALLPTAAAAFVDQAGVFVVHFPEGNDKGIGIGALGGIDSLTTRWGHTVQSRGGSSGGGCFDTNLALVGIHQGKGPVKGGRLVPAGSFLKDVMPIATTDQAPPRMWSLDGTPDGEYVIGRQAFFEAYALARGHSRVRGIRVKRADATGDLAGLSFSFAMLDRMTARSPDTRQIRISFETLIPDLADDIVRRAATAGIELAPIEDRAGVARGQSAPEAVGADRGRRAATALDERAGDMRIQLWLFIDHPAIAFGDGLRAALEGFIDQALKLPNLRLVVAGFEAVAIPGLEFQALPNPPDIGAPGLMADYITGFGESDVRLFIADAASAAGKTLSPEYTDELVQTGLGGLANVNGIYEPWLAGKVAANLRADVHKIFGMAP
jgi:hypothetical protein